MVLDLCLGGLRYRCPRMYLILYCFILEIIFELGQLDRQKQVTGKQTFPREEELKLLCRPFLPIPKEKNVKKRLSILSLVQF